MIDWLAEVERTIRENEAHDPDFYRDPNEPPSSYRLLTYNELRAREGLRYVTLQDGKGTRRYYPDLGTTRVRA